MEIVLSILVLAAFALLAGAVWLWRKGGARQQALLMAILAVIALVNVAIWTVPQPDGTAPISQIPD